MGDPKDDVVVSIDIKSEDIAEPDSSQIFKNLEQFTAKNNNNSAVINTLFHFTILYY